MRVYVYGDESGNFDFGDQEGASRYFILTTVVVRDHAIESDLLELRRELVWEGEPLGGGFHATDDKRESMMSSAMERPLTNRHKKASRLSDFRESGQLSSEEALGLLSPAQLTIPV